MALSFEEFEEGFFAGSTQALVFDVFLFGEVVFKVDSAQGPAFGSSYVPESSFPGSTCSDFHSTDPVGFYLSLRKSKGR